MTEQQPKMQPWQVFHGARKAMGAAVVARIFNRSIRSAHDWAQDPTCTEVRCKSPLELLHTLFERMDAIGYGYAARAAIWYLETALDHDVDVAVVPPVKDTLEQEILADYAAVAALQRAIDAGEPVDVVHEFKHVAMDEIDRTFAKYCKEQQG
jgi:hypothetical protein